MDDPEPVHGRSRLLRLLGEMVGVGIGVFLALAADAAWDAHLDRQTERSYLENLLQEMRAASDELRVDNNLRKSRLDNLEKLRAQIVSRTASDSLLAVWLADFSPFTAFFPPGAVLEDLVSSGNLHLIRSDQLRFALMDYAQEKPRLRFREDLERHLSEENIRPFLFERVSHLRGEQEPGALDTLLTSRIFENLLDQRVQLLRRTIDRAEVVDSAASHVVELIEEELGAAS